MTAYLISSYTVDDAEAFAPYPPSAVAAVKAHGGEILVADAAPDVKEGRPYERHVIVKFASKAAADAFYHGDAYQSVVRHRIDNSHGIVILCAGLDD